MTVPHERPRRSPTEQSRLDDGLRDMFQSRIAFDQTLGLRVLSVDPGKAGMGFDMTPALVGHYLGGRVASTQMALHDEEDELIATGAGAYVVS